MRLSLALLLLMGFLAHSANAANNEQSAAVFSPGALEHAWTDGPFTMGFKFRVNQPIAITAVGVFDDGNNGLAAPHAVRLWDALRTPIYTTTVPAGVAAPLTDRFRYVSIAPIVLPVNSEFMIAAANYGGTTDPYLAIDAVPQSSSRITLYDSHYSYAPAGNLVFPNIGISYTFPSHFGANFRFVAVPEPSGILLSMAVAIGYRWWRRQ
jgi:hypothetical protein